MSTQNIGFYEDLTKIIFELSSNTHLISSAVSVVLSTSHVFYMHRMPYSSHRNLLFYTYFK